MTRIELIHQWLNQVDEPDQKPVSLEQTHSSLRKRAYPISPEPEDHGDLREMDLSTPKKRRVEVDNDKTPRPFDPNAFGRRSPSLSPTKSSASLHSSSHASSHASSRASSSRRPLSSIAVGREGIDKRQLQGPGTPQLPKPIKAALEAIRGLERCQGILSSSLKTSLPTSFLTENCLDDVAFADSGGSCLTSSDVAEILDDAKNCFENEHDEAVWNVEVHHPLIKKVFRSTTSPSFNRIINFTLSTTAPITKYYLPELIPERRIDFCIYIDPSSDPTILNKIESMCDLLPSRSINHSSYKPMRKYPAAVSIETKRSGNDFEGGVAQLAIWQAAHWKMLRQVLHKICRERMLTTLPKATPEEVNALAQSQVDNSLAELGALHGILIQGHEWYYVATSPQFMDSQGNASLRTNLWLHQPIALTNQALGIHQVAAFLEYLKKYSAETYWPWFKRNVLEIGHT